MFIPQQWGMNSSDPYEMCQDYNSQEQQRIFLELPAHVSEKSD